jgi:hypothetical protein
MMKAMTKLEKLEQAIEALSPEDFAKFRAWFEEFQERAFDEAIARDAAEGKLDKLAAEARADYDAGRCEEI